MSSEPDDGATVPGVLRLAAIGTTASRSDDGKTGVPVSIIEITLTGPDAGRRVSHTEVVPADLAGSPFVTELARRRVGAAVREQFAIDDLIRTLPEDQRAEYLRCAQQMQQFAGGRVSECLHDLIAVRASDARWRGPEVDRHAGDELPCWSNDDRLDSLRYGVASMTGHRSATGRDDPVMDRTALPPAVATEDDWTQSPDSAHWSPAMLDPDYGGEVEWAS